MRSKPWLIGAAITVVVGTGLLRILSPQTTGSGPDLGLYCDFERVGVWDISPEEGFSLELSTEHMTQGVHALKVTFPRDEWPSINTKKLRQPVRQFDALTLDVFNPQDQAVPFAVRLDDRARKKVTVSQSLNPGMNHVRIPRERLRGLDATKLFFVVLFLERPGRETTLYFDNLCLVNERPSQPATAEASPVAASAPHPAARAVIAPPPRVPPQTSGRLAVSVLRLSGAAGTPALVSAGVPFAPGQLRDDRHVRFLRAGVELPTAVQVLARWPQDESIRSLLVQFRMALDERAEDVVFEWGQPRAGAEVVITPVAWDYPEAWLLLPASWMCDSQVLGPQVPLYEHNFSEYDERLRQYYPIRRDDPRRGDVRQDGYYSTPHVFYQLYVRSADPDVFVAARRELLAYRERDIVHEGPEKGRPVVDAKTRYVYVEALADDYLLTGDPRSRAVAQDMANFLLRQFPPAKAFYPRTATNFWTEREAAFPFLGVLSYYEISGDTFYRRAADAYLANLFRTQQEWPNRGGFIHNLYAHDTEEGARPDEYGGSPFMTGLLLEPIVRYHWLTGSDTAAQSIVLAVDWLLREGLAPDGETFLYMTSDAYRGEEGEPDLNMLIVHAFGYGYYLSGYQRTDYLDTGLRAFRRGVRDAYLGTRKHFNQNFRSSGHFLAYVTRPGGVTAQAVAVEEPATRPADGAFYQAEFTQGPDGWQAASNHTLVEWDSSDGFSGRGALRVRSTAASQELAAGRRFEGWRLDLFPTLQLAYRLPEGWSAAVRCKTPYHEWVTLGEPGVAEVEPTGPADSVERLTGDGHWQERTLDVREAIHRVLPGIDEVTECQVFTQQPAEVGTAFWLDHITITR